VKVSSFPFRFISSDGAAVAGVEDLFSGSVGMAIYVLLVAAEVGFSIDVYDFCGTVDDFNGMIVGAGVIGCYVPAAAEFIVCAAFLAYFPVGASTGNYNLFKSNFSYPYTGAYSSLYVSFFI